MHVIVDDETCIGCGLCAENCPEIFVTLNDKARAKTDEVPDELEDACRETAEDCPVEAIAIEE
jgi:ferredoxin